MVIILLKTHAKKLMLLSCMTLTYALKVNVYSGFQQAKNTLSERGTPPQVSDCPKQQHRSVQVLVFVGTET